MCNQVQSETISFSEKIFLQLGLGEKKYFFIFICPAVYFHEVTGTWLLKFYAYVNVAWNWSKAKEALVKRWKM